MTERPFIKQMTGRVQRDGSLRKIDPMCLFKKYKLGIYGADFHP